MVLNPQEIPCHTLSSTSLRFLWQVCAYSDRHTRKATGVWAVHVSAKMRHKTSRWRRPVTKRRVQHKSIPHAARRELIQRASPIRHMIAANGGCGGAFNYQRGRAAHHSHSGANEAAGEAGQGTVSGVKHSFRSGILIVVGREFRLSPIRTASGEH